jgi:hypothetical protein
MINMLHLSISEIDLQHSVGIMRTEMKDASFDLSWIRLKSPTTQNTHSTFRGHLQGLFHTQEKNLLGKSAQCHQPTGTVSTMSPECRKDTE